MRTRKIKLMGMKMVRSVKSDPRVSKGLIATGLVIAIAGGIILARKGRQVCWEERFSQLRRVQQSN